MRLKIYKGQDKTIVFKLRHKNGDPVDLTGLTNIYIAFQKADKSDLLLSKNQVAAKKASAIVYDVAFIADNAGANSNSIILSFDGIQTVDAIVTDWNTANPSNTLTYEGEGAFVLPTQNVQLTGGYDSFIPVSILNEVLGKVQCILTDYDTSSLRIGKNQNVKFTLDFGAVPTGTRIITVLDGSLDVMV